MLLILASLSTSSAVRSARCVSMGASQEMQLRKLGHSDILVSECCLGGMTWGNQNSEEEGFAQLDLAAEFGINFVDTAEGYPVPLSPETQGRTDEIIGRWLKARNRPRDSTVISTKVCGYSDRYTWFRQDGSGTRLTNPQIRESVDASLKRLNVEEIDLLQFHWPERPVGLTRAGLIETDKEKSRKFPITSYEEQVAAIGELIEAGKVRTWGLSNENEEGIRAFRAAASALNVPQPVCVQNAYSLLQRGDEGGLLDAMLDDIQTPKELVGAASSPAESLVDQPASASALKSVTSVSAGSGSTKEVCSYIPYSPLSAGVLTGKYAKGRKVPRRSRLSLFKGYSTAFQKTDGPKAVDAYCALARKHGMTPSQLAIAHCNSRSFVGSTIIGATSITQLAENLVAFGLEWDAELEAAVSEIYARYPNPWNVQVPGGG